MSIRDMFSTSFIPPYFKDIFNHLPHALVDLISWKEIFSELTILSSRLRNSKDIAKENEIIFEKFNQELLINLPRIELVKSLENSPLDKNSAEKILELYFYQIMESDILFLDLRSVHFSKKNHSNDIDLQWMPGNLWASFDSYFKEGIRNVYLGYYGEDDVLFRNGLIACQLIKDQWPEEQKKEVETVFQRHFSNGKSEEVTFDLQHFKNSFGEIFKTLLKNKITLDKNFLYLGIMLITLYMTLGEIGGSYNMGTIFKYKK